MTRTDLFKAAHAITRATIQAGDDYRTTFGAALRGLITGALVMANREREARNGKEYVQVPVGVRVGVRVFCVTTEGARRFSKKARQTVAAAFVVCGLGKVFVDSCGNAVVRAYAA